MSEDEKIIYFNSIFDFECRLGLSCVGALLKFLNSAQNFGSAHDDDYDRLFTRYEINRNNFLTEIVSVRPINLDKVLILDANAFQSLEIFSDVDFACAFKQTNSSASGHFRTCLNNKKKHSLYSLYLSKIRTKMGIRKLRSIMLKPTREASVLNERHELINFLAQQSNQTFVAFLGSCLKSCKYIGPIMLRMKTAKCSLADWKRVLSTIEAFLKISLASKILIERMRKGFKTFFFNLLNLFWSNRAQKILIFTSNFNKNEYDYF